MTKTITSLSLDEARKLVAAGEQHAVELGVAVNIAVADAGANLTAFARMDGAWLGSVDIAIKKAFTARAFDISTDELGGNAQPGEQFYGINASNDGKVMIFAGGLPVEIDGQIVGGVGVSGGTGEQDQAIVEAAVAAAG